MLIVFLINSKNVINICFEGLALQCYKCEEKTNGVTNSCHINDNSYGTTEMCSTQESACFKETKSKFYLLPPI